MQPPDLPSREKIGQTLVDCLRFLSGKACPAEFTINTDVLRECDLDSEDGVEIACDLSRRLGIAIPAKDNPLIDDTSATGRKRARTFGEVVEYLAALEKK
jgi:acyl carrier protein